MRRMAALAAIVWILIQGSYMPPARQTKTPIVHKEALIILELASIVPNVEPKPVQEAPIVRREVSRGSVKAESKTLTVQVTAYTWTGHQTFTGTWPQLGTIAVDPSVIPLGTRLYVPGYGWGRAEDTGSAIKGNIIDVYYPTEKEARQWGRQKGVRVLIYPK